MSVNSTDPGLLFGGTWVQISGRFLYCTDNSMDTGGEATHTLTINEMPSHKHTISGNWARDKGSGGWGASIGTYDNYVFEPTDITSRMSNAGGGQAHNNMPPYFTVYCWYRVS